MRKLLCGLAMTFAATCYAAPKGPGDVYFDAAQKAFVRVDEKGAAQPVKTLDDWKAARAAILLNMQKLFGDYPDAKKKVPLDPKVIEEKDCGSYIRRKVTIAVEPGDRMPMYLLMPKGIKGKIPAMLCLHQTTSNGKAEPAGLAGGANLHYAQELAERGYIALAPDNAMFGEYATDPYTLGYESSPMKDIWDNQRALDYLQSLPEVDGERIGSIGHSRGGHGGLFLAAFDERVKIVACNCGFSHFSATTMREGDIKIGMPRIRTVFNRDLSKMPFDFEHVLAAIAPRPILINTADGDTYIPAAGVDDCVESARTVYALYHAEDAITLIHSPGGHDFPPSAREKFYKALDKFFGFEPAAQPAPPAK